MVVQQEHFFGEVELCNNDFFQSSQKLVRISASNFKVEIQMNMELIKMIYIVPPELLVA